MDDAKDLETPTQALAQMANTASHMDGRGRLITVKRLDALQFYRLTKAMGEVSSTEAAMDMAMLACAVSKIDATPVAFPNTEREVEFLIQQLNFDGIAAAGEALKKLSTDKAAEAEVAKN